MNEYQVAALWIGDQLSFLEELCLKSFVDAGQHTVLFTYGEVGNVPDGVEVRDGNEILPNPRVQRHSRTNSPALFSDLFRYHMLNQMTDTIWVDTDAYCVKKFETSTGHFHAWESKRGINGGVLGLPKDSATLRHLLEFTSDEYAIPEWFSQDEQTKLREAKEAGHAVHASDMQWGVWGPRALTYFLKKTDEVRFTLPQAALYPIHYRDRRFMTRPGWDYQQFLTDETFSIHLYGRRIRSRISTRFGGVPRPRSMVGKLLRKHGIDPTRNPLPDLRPDAQPAAETSHQE